MRLLNLHFAENPRVSIASLREAYSLNNIKLHSSAISIKHTPAKLAQIDREKLQRLGPLIEAVNKRQTVVFIDECVYTQRSLIKTVWKKPCMLDVFPKNRLGFDAIAVLGAIDVKGQLKVLITRPKSIGVPELI